MQAKTERFEMRLDQDMIDQIDRWRSDQNDVPSRAEAARRLIEAGLEQQAEKRVHVSDGEKLILTMMHDLYRRLDIKDGEIDPSFVLSAISGGHNWALDWTYQGLFHRHEDSRQEVREVVDILDMWSFLEGGYAKLGDADKARIASEAGTWGKHVSFLGFDGNNESTHRSIALFLVRDMDRFSDFKGRELNSHMPLLDAYRSMLRVFLPMRATLTGGGLSVAQIIAVLKARERPR